MPSQIFVVQGYYRSRGGVFPDWPIVCSTKELALRRGELLAEQRLGVLIYAVQLETEAGECITPVMLARLGDPPGLED